MPYPLLRCEIFSFHPTLSEFSFNTPKCHTTLRTSNVDFHSHSYCFLFFRHNEALTYYKGKQLPKVSLPWLGEQRFSIYSQRTMTNFCSFREAQERVKRKDFEIICKNCGHCSLECIIPFAGRLHFVAVYHNNSQ